MKKKLLACVLLLAVSMTALASISNQTNKVFGSGDNITKIFGFPFKVFKNTDLQVYEINTTSGNATGPMTLNTDYSVYINPISEGGSVSFTNAPLSGINTLIERIEPFTQSVSLSTEGPLPPKQIENQLDLSMMTIIQLAEQVGRIISLPISSSLNNLVYPVPAANTLIGWNATGTGLQNFVNPVLGVPNGILEGIGGNITTTNLHIVIYTVAPAGASASDKARADFIGDGVNDQVAVMAAIVAANAVNGFAEVKMLPGTYIFSAAANIAAQNGFVFDAEGTQIIGPSGTADTFTFNSGTSSCIYKFGTVSSPGSTGSLIHFKGGSNDEISWQVLQGTLQQGNGLYLDSTATGASQSTNRFHGGPVYDLDKGINISTFGAGTSEDTDMFQVNEIFNNNIGIYEHQGAGGGAPNSNIWTVDVDASWSPTGIGIETNGQYDVWNVILGSQQAGTKDMQLDSGASGNILNLTPYSQAVAAGGIVDNSGNTTNSVNVGMRTQYLSGDARGHIAVWDETIKGQLKDAGGSIIFTSPRTLTINNSIGLAGTNGQTYTFPTTSSTIPATTYQGISKAWVNYNGVSGAILSSFNVASVTHLGAGYYQVNFSTPMSDTNYGVGITARRTTTFTSSGDQAEIFNTGNVTVAHYEAGVRTDANPIFIDIKR